MSHSSKISQSKRSLIALLIDQSGSMAEPYGSTEGGALARSKAEVVSEASNVMLMDIIARCRDGATYKHYFDIIVMGYSGRGVYSLLCNNRWIVSPAELAATVRSNRRVSRRVKVAGGGTITHYNNLKIWVEAESDGATPMCAALTKLSELIALWRTNQRSDGYFPPTIINITDGEATDARRGELTKIRERIAGLGSSDGAPTLFNLHISSSGGGKVLFPRSIEEVPEQARELYQLSSAVPEIYNDVVMTLKGDSGVEGETYRAFSYNLPMVDFISAMQIGTTTTMQIHQ